MNLNQLEWFCAAYELGSFAKAAEAGYVSRQALGKAMRALEAELGCVLFDRNEGGSRPTAAAAALYPAAQRCVAAAADVRLTARDLARAGLPEVRIAVADSMTASLPPDFFDKLEEAFPNVDFLVEKHFFEGCLKHLAAGDVAFAVCPGPAPAGLSAIELATYPVYVGVPTGEQFVLPLTLAQLAHETFFTVGGTLQGNLGATEVFAQAGYTLRTNGHYTDYPIILKKVASGQGVALVPELEAEAAYAAGLDLLPFPDDAVRWTVQLLYLEQNLSPLERDLVVYFTACV